MNTKLYNAALKTLDTVLAPMTGEIIEDHVADSAQIFDDRTFQPKSRYWADDVEEVTKELCNKFNVEYDDGE